ncbi:hypothetical protein [Streptomyces sp. NPDC002276]
MHEIFVNYRTKGGKEVAYSCDRVLSARFGPDSVFLARKSIEPGDNTGALVRGARRSHVLLALVDEEWLDAPDRDRPDRRALDNPQDWVRREIEEALLSGVLIVPLFIGRRVEQLDPGVCPGRSRRSRNASTRGWSCTAWMPISPGSLTVSCAWCRPSPHSTAVREQMSPQPPNPTSRCATTTRAAESARSAAP